MTLHLFEGYGIEIEYMLVSIEDLSIVPASDRAVSRRIQAAGPDARRKAIACP